MAATASQILDALNDAILAKIQGNVVQSYSVNGRDIRYMSLDQMRAFRRELMAEYGRSQGARNYVQFEDPQ